MVNPITVRDIIIGEGEPKIIVPIVGSTRTEIEASASKIVKSPIHMLEWRVDFYDKCFNAADVLGTLGGLRDIVGKFPILFTFRTQKEGGNKPISAQAYTALNIAVAQSQLADLIDVEVFSGDSVVAKNIDAIHAAGCLVILSNHNFNMTPAKDELVGRLRKMQTMGADILKIAVMPQSTEDVLTLLAATNEMNSRYADKPVVTMSMSPLGIISRLAGEVFGSAMTFGSVGNASAPGQIPVAQLKTALTIIHDSL